MKVIFLDIDGVLCVNWMDEDEFGHLFHNPYVKNLERVIKETGAKIVVSSTWRKSGIKSLREMWYARDLPGEIIDITPVLWTQRGEEIAEYLRENPCDKYVIFDDDTDFLDEQKPFFVRCSGNKGEPDAINGCGLTFLCAEKAVKILKD